MSRLADLDPIDRPREKFLRYGAQRLSDAELLAILLRTGRRGKSAVDMAKELLKQYSLPRLAAMTADDLAKTTLLGTAQACAVAAAMELCARVATGHRAELLLTPADVWAALADVRSNRREHFVVFFLTSRGQEITREIISVGTLTESMVHPREAFEPAIRHGAAQVLFAHNHPSGNPEPSTQDLGITRRLVAAGELLGISVLDHVVVTRDRYASIRARHETTVWIPREGRISVAEDHPENVPLHV